MMQIGAKNIQTRVWVAAIAAVFVAGACSPSDAATIQVNLGPAGLPTETGFTNWTTAENTTPTPTTIDGVGFSLFSSKNFSSTPNNTVRSINRSGTYAGPYVGPLANLTQTWWGAGSSGSTVGAFMAIAIDGADLGAGTFEFTSWHHDHDNQSGIIDIEVSTDGGANFSIAIDNFDQISGDYDSDFSDPNPATFSFMSNGVDDVVIRFTNVNASDGQGSFAFINGFRLEGDGVQVPTPAALPAGLVALGLFAGRRRRRTAIRERR